TIALALGVQRMIRRKAIVRRLPSVETLGCASVICSDKTGTLTQNKMTVTRVWLDGRLYEVTGTGYETKGGFWLGKREISPRRSKALQRLLEIGVLCNNAALVREEGGGMLRRKKAGWRIDGDPTEGALLVVGAKGGLHREEIERRWQRVKEYPFDSERKRMSVLVEGPGGERMLLSKGAPDVLLERCTDILRNGKVRPVSESLRDEVLRMNGQLAAMALRNLAFAYRELPAGKDPGAEESAERNLVFVGLAGMIDPPREEVKEAIRRCRQAGIKPVMITGDHKGTAVAIARQLGILTDGGLAVEGQELDRMGESGLQEKVSRIDVYARVSPEHKL